MTTAIRTIAQAFVDLAAGADEGEREALADAAVELLKRHGLLNAARTFPALVEKLWRRKEQAVEAVLATPTGAAGAEARAIGMLLSSALQRPCTVEERAEPALIGGAVLTVGDERFDYSVRRMLADIVLRQAPAFATELRTGRQNDIV